MVTDPPYYSERIYNPLNPLFKEQKKSKLFL